jgi:AcrR family transcriptional regulator
MFSKFFNLNQEKQDRILNAALKEFVQKGYENASTNEIVKEAEISKGLLFHYFKNKKTLYLFLYEHFMEMFIQDIVAKLDRHENEIFARYRQIGLLKFELYSKYPEMFNFIKSIYKEDASEVKGDIDKLNKKFLNTGYQDLFGDIDYSKFKEDIDVEKAINVIYWTLEGFAYQYLDKVTALNIEEIDFEGLMAEMEVYCEMLRNAFYK